MIAATFLSLAIAVALGYWNWRRSQFRTGVLFLEMLRFATIAGLLFLLQQPEWTTEYRPSEKPNLVVLIDRSRSMETRDIPSAESASEPFQSRESVANQLESDAYWARVSDRFEVAIEGFPLLTDKGDSASVGRAVEPIFTTPWNLC